MNYTFSLKIGPFSFYIFCFYAVSSIPAKNLVFPSVDIYKAFNKRQQEFDENV